MAILTLPLLFLATQGVDPKPLVVGPWSIVKGDDSSCTMRSRHADGTIISFIRGANGAGAVAFSNPAWVSLSKAQEPYVRVDVNEYPYRFYKAEVLSGATVSRFSGAALNRLADQKAISVFFKGQAILVTYTGGVTQVAFRQLDARAGFSADPFAS